MSEPLRLRRVTLPRYEFEYSTAALALEHAKGVRQSRVLKISLTLSEQLGAEIVSDLQVTDLPLTTTLLFRPVQHTDPGVVLEWWPRRKTDPDVLDIWIEGLEAHVHKFAPSMPPSLSQDELHKLLDLCRGALSHNPFVALGLHWTARGEDVERAATKIEQTLRGYRARTGLTARGAELLDAALAGVPAARNQLSTLEGRQLARARFVPRDQLRHAHAFAVTRAEFASIRGTREEKQQAANDLHELTPAGKTR